MLGDYNEDRPNEANVVLYEGLIGGQTSFSDQTPVENFIYNLNTTALTGSYAGNAISLSAGLIVTNVEGRIQEVGAGQMFDSRKIGSLTFNGKTYLPNPYKYSIARKNQAGALTSRLITHDKDCFFVSCYNGIQQVVKWNFSYSTGAITIITDKDEITGTIVNDNFSTPTIQATDGNLYIIQFFSSYTQICPCIMEFTLYKVDTRKAEPQQPNFKLVIGGC
jgi:hypothetical protein